MTGFDDFSLSLAVPTEAEADRAFAALADGGQVTMPLTKRFYSPRFGMVTDRFGLGWMVIVPAETTNSDCGASLRKRWRSAGSKIVEPWSLIATRKRS